MRANLALLVALTAAFLSTARAAEDADVVIAERGTAAVTFAELDGRMLEVDPDKRAGFLDSPERIDKMVNDLMLLEQLANEAKEAGLDRREDVRALVSLAEKRILSSLWMQELRTRAAKPDVAALANETYLADPDRYKSEEKLVLRHILINAKDACDPAAEARAQHVREEAIKGEKSFADLARVYSEDIVTRKEGGLMPEMGRGRSVKPFEDAAFALRNPGDISPVVKTEFGYHIIQLQSRTPAQRRPFEVVRAEVEAKIEAEARMRAQKEHTDNLQNLPIKAEPEVVASLRQRYDAAGNVARPYRDPTTKRDQR
jgi:peptidyl-prolyl cis-trans isomerase C